MVIEVTKRYIIGKHTLDSILEDYCMYDHDETENFSNWLLDRIENEYYDEKIYQVILNRYGNYVICLKC